MDTALVAAMCVVGASTTGLLAWTGRSLWATHRTAYDKHKMLNLCKHHSLVYRYWSDLSISFIEHHSQYMMFRNPWRMYSSQFIDLAWRHGVISTDQYTDAFHFALKREADAKEARIQAFADDLIASTKADAVQQSDTHSGNPQLSRTM